MTNPKLPDLRGTFLRGWNNDRDSETGDPDAASRTGGDKVGSTQEDQVQSHKHNDRGHTHANDPHVHIDRGHRHQYRTHGNFSSPGGAGAEPSISAAYGGGHSDPVGKADISSTAITIKNGLANISDPVQSSGGEPRHGAGTRPKNASVNFIIKC